MPELGFRIGEAIAAPYSALPAITARLHITNAPPDEPVQSILLNCQVQIEPLGRAYSAAEEAELLDLFGERGRWARTMKPMLWANLLLKVPAFTRETAIDLVLPCTMDFEIAATKYFYGLEAGVIQVSGLFSGTVFYSDENGFLQATQIPWDREARFQLAADVWRKAIEAHYPDSAWLRLPKETFDRLYLLKVARGIPTWDRLLNELMDRNGDAESARLSAATGVVQ